MSEFLKFAAIIMAAGFSFSDGACLFIALLNLLSPKEKNSKHLDEMKRRNELLDDQNATLNQICEELGGIKRGVWR